MLTLTQMLEHLTRTSNKKFYNKWKYKITLEIKGASAFRIYNRTRLKDLLLHGEVITENYWIKNLEADKGMLLDLIMYIEQHKLFLRVERNSINFYTNDENIYNDFSSRYITRLKHRYELVAGAVEEKEGECVLFVKKYPHGKYHYKVFLAPHNANMEDKVQWINWLNSQGDRIKISDTVKSWFITTSWNWDRRYMYVEDEATLLMLKIRSAKIVGKTYQYRLIDK